MGKYVKEILLCGIVLITIWTANVIRRTIKLFKEIKWTE